MSYSELGRRVGLTPPAVIERVRRIEESGVITGYRADVNVEKLGRPLAVIIRLAGNHGGCTDARGCILDAFIQRTPEILQCDHVTGEDCYVIKAAVNSTQHLESLLSRLAVHGKTTTSMILSSPVTYRVVEPQFGDERVLQDRGE